jgi:hypothetical protein
VDRLDFVLPEFVRVSWVSDAARATWESRFAQVTRAWLQLEWRSVAAGLRGCGVTLIAPTELPGMARDWAHHGMTGFPLELAGPIMAMTPVGAGPAAPDQFAYRVVVGTPDSVRAFRDAWDRGDDDTMGRLLGCPACCVAFSRHVFDQGLIDTTWPMAVGSTTPPDESHCIDIAGPAEANPLWQWIGLRTVPHVPCRCTCEGSIEIGRALVALGKEAGFRQEMDWLQDILSWPVEWSSLHGIAEIRTPVLKGATRTDAMATRYTIRRHGTAYPPEGARGLRFPYRAAPRAAFSASRAFQRGLANPLVAAASNSPGSPLHEEAR